MSTGGLIARLLACLFLVFATWNPSGVSYVDWIGGPAPLSLKAVATAGLALSHILFVRITWLSLGPLGLGFLVLLLLSGIFALSQLGAIDMGRPLTRGYAFLTAMALVLLVGLAWSLMKRRVTGQSNYLNQPP